MDNEEQQLSLIPDLIRDPDRRRERENNRRIEEFMRRLIAEKVKDQSSYRQRFLSGE